MFLVVLKRRRRRRCITEESVPTCLCVCVWCNCKWKCRALKIQREREWDGMRWERGKSIPLFFHSRLSIREEKRREEKRRERDPDRDGRVSFINVAITSRRDKHMHRFFFLSFFSFSSSRVCGLNSKCPPRRLGTASLVIQLLMVHCLETGNSCKKKGCNNNNNS